MAVFCLILGAIAFLIMVYPMIFWFVFIPIVLMLGIATIKWLKK